MVVDANQASAMSPTLSEGDVVTVRIVWDGMVSVGDLVVFDDPTKGEGTSIRRVLAKGGQTVDIRDGSVVVDGTVLDEPYTQGKPTTPLSEHMSGTGPIAYPYTVPEGHIWVDELREVIGADVYPKWKDLERRAIRPAFTEINGKSDMAAEYVPIYTKNKVTALEITVSTKEAMERLKLLAAIETDFAEDQVSLWEGEK